MTIVTTQTSLKGGGAAVAALEPGTATETLSKHSPQTVPKASPRRRPTLRSTFSAAAPDASARLASAEATEVEVERKTLAESGAPEVPSLKPEVVTSPTSGDEGCGGSDSSVSVEVPRREDADDAESPRPPVMFRCCLWSGILLVLVLFVTAAVWVYYSSTTSVPSAHRHRGDSQGFLGAHQNVLGKSVEGTGRIGDIVEA